MKKAIAWLRALFPFTHDGRQTLVYLIFAGSGPALTLIAIWIMQTARDLGWRGVFEAMASKIGWALLITVCALACFVSIRAIKLGSSGLDVQGRDRPE